MDILPSELEPIANHILFQFQDEVDKAKKGAFLHQTKWGFELPTQLDDTTKTPRWVVIIGLGPEVSEEFHIGQKVLVEALKWTRVVDYKGVRFARTDPDQIIAVDDDDVI